MVAISKKNVVNVLVSDVYSFEEEEAVLDPVISEHLSHFGIDMLQMQNRVSCSAVGKQTQQFKVSTGK